jgi:hypothetical protein
VSVRVCEGVVLYLGVCCACRSVRPPPTMPIIYALVARGPTVLAEHASTTGNFAKVTQSILEKIPATNSKMSYVYDRCVGRSPRAPVRPPLG